LSINSYLENIAINVKLSRLDEIHMYLYQLTCNFILLFRWWAGE